MMKNVSNTPTLEPRALSRWRRFFEIIPGFSSWAILLGIVVCAILDPIAAAIFVICFYLFWLFRLLYMTVLLIASYAALYQERDTDWIERCGDWTDLEGAKKRAAERASRFREKFEQILDPDEKSKLKRQLRSERAYAGRLERYFQSKSTSLDFRSVFHVVIFPNYREETSVLESTLDALCQTNYPLDRFIVVMAFEEREGKKAHEKARELVAKFENRFYAFLTTFHPPDLPGERAVKGANATWAAKEVVEFLASKGIPFDHVLVSCFDADTCVGKEYFGCLTYNFLIRPDRTNCSYQPIPVYHNNLWQAPAFARMLETSSSYWQLVESANPDHLVTFSSHSMSFKALVEAGFWPVDMISDDSAIFWRCFLHYKSAYRVVPLAITLSMNIVIGESWLDTFRKIYVQKRRWAWGIENFPMIMLGFLEDRAIPVMEKLRHGFKMLESHVSWATWGLMVTLFGWLPIILGGREYGLSVVSYNLPRISQVIFNLAGISFLVSVILSFLITPKPPPHLARFRNLSVIVQWFMLPIILPLLLALPALDAQTRLMMGRYLGFEVSRKV